MDQPTNHQPTHYEILSVSPSIFSSSSGISPEETKQLLKKSYRRALLSHHPDKSSGTKTTTTATYSIDQITLAFTTLSTPSLRQAYDLSLSTSDGTDNPSGLGKHKLQTGIETIDLDDLTHQKGEGEQDSWFRPCRCGNPKGFLVLESDLEEAADSGVEEVVVGCADCSLWLRVVFGVVQEEEEENDTDTAEQQQQKTCQGSSGGGCCRGGR